MFITFIIPSLGRPSLNKAIDSLDNLNSDDWKAIVVLDGVEKDIQHEKVKVIQSEKIGSAGLLRNIAMQEVDTKWIGFLDDDDILYSRYIDELKLEDDYHKELGFVLFRMMRDRIIPRPGLYDVVQGQVGISFAIKNELVKQHDLKFVKSGPEDFHFLKNMVDLGIKGKVSDYVAYGVRK